MPHYGADLRPAELKHTIRTSELGCWDVLWRIGANCFVRSYGPCGWCRIGPRIHRLSGLDHDPCVVDQKVETVGPGEEVI